MEHNISNCKAIGDQFNVIVATSAIKDSQIPSVQEGNKLL